MSAKSIPAPINLELPMVTVPICADNYTQAGAMVDILEKSYFKNNYKQISLCWVETGLFVASFGNQGNSALRWANEEFITTLQSSRCVKEEVANVNVEEDTSCTTS